MIYNENGALVNKNFVTIDGTKFDMSIFSECYIHEDATNNEKFNKLMDEIKQEISECDDENIKNVKVKGVFLSQKLKKILSIASFIFGLASLPGWVKLDADLQGQFGFINVKVLILTALLTISSALLGRISLFPRKEMKHIQVAEDVVRFYDKIANNKSLPDNVREKAMENARKLAVKINKAKAALKGDPWWEQVDWGISSDILLQNIMVYFGQEVTNTKYESNKAYYDSIIREINSKYQKIMKDIAKRIKSDYKTNSNIQALTADDVYNALGPYAADMFITGQKVIVYVYVCEKDSFDKNASNIPVVLGKVLKVQFIYENNKLSYDYFETNMRSYS